MRLPPGSLVIVLWLSVWLVYTAFVTSVNLWEWKRGKWTRRGGLGSIIAVIIMGAILAAILFPVYVDELVQAERVRLHRLYPHRHFED